VVKLTDQQLQSNAFNNFIIHIRSPHTKIIYISALDKFKIYCQVDDYQDLLFNEDPKRIQSLISDFLIHYQNEGLSSSTIRHYKSSLKFFYDMNDITLINWAKTVRVMKEYTKVANDRPYTTTEIAKLLERTDHRGRIIILLMASSGMRQGAIHLLKIGHLERLQDIYKITVYKNTEDQYVTFCSPECAAAINDYLEYRKLYGEKIKNESPLIREQFNKINEKQAATPKPVGDKAIASIIYRAIVDSGIREKKNIVKGQRKFLHEVMQSHGLRKFFDTSVTLAGMPLLYSEMLMGHRDGLAIQSYVKPPVHKLLEEYLNVVDSVTINEEYRLQKQVKKLEEEKTYWAEMRKDLDELRSLVKK
jgi:integrase